MGLRYPERAERLSDTDYSEYRVFTEFWDDLLTVMSDAVRRLHANSSVHVIGVYGPQGAGKTLFARQLQTDYNEVGALLRTNNTQVPRDNVWSHITGGPSRNF